MRQGDRVDAVFDSGKAFSAYARVSTPAGEEACLCSSDDVREVFEEFLEWYLDRLAPGEEPQEALRVLLESSDFGGG